MPGGAGIGASPKASSLGRFSFGREAQLTESRYPLTVSSRETCDSALAAISGVANSTNAQVEVLTSLTPVTPPKT